ncbi:MAG: DUF2974 domain-containing protein [Clostridia bacterium]
MPNILDYLNWRGDLPLTQTSLCEVDALIFSRLAYIPFDGIVSESFSTNPIPLAQAAETCLALVHDKDSTRDFRIKDDDDFLNALISSPRFATLGLVGYVNHFNAESQEQFSATTVLLPNDELYIAFRGTDGTIIGWKEDFNMSFADVVPAQIDAVDYLTRAAQQFPGKIRIGGHSKGGNLAVYAAAFCKHDLQERIFAIRNHDGPGFNAATIHTEGFQRVIGRIRTYLPQSSVVGMLLEHAEDFCVIHSTNLGLMQHDVYSWEVVRGGFAEADGLTNSSQFVDITLKDWVTSMTPDLREKMIDGIFSVLSASEGTTLRDLWNGKNTIAVLKALSNMDDNTRALLKEGYRILEHSMKKALPTAINQWFAQTPTLAKLLHAEH